MTLGDTLAFVMIILVGKIQLSQGCYQLPVAAKYTDYVT